MITYQEEKFDDVIEEMKPLLEDHYVEVAMYQDKIELNPNWGIYQAMNDVGNVHIFTARDDERDGKLIGYCVTFMQNNPHYMDHEYAVNDVIYVDPEYRHTEVAPMMLSELEKIMKSQGVSVMTFHMKTHLPFETLMQSLGYDDAEKLYTKYIKD